MSIFNEKNQQVKESYIKNVNEINQIYQETLQKKEEVFKFFNALTQEAMKMIDLEKRDQDAFVDQHSVDELLKDNHNNYYWLMQDNYNQSYANPVFAVEMLGETYGPSLSALYFTTSQLVMAAFGSRIIEINDVLSLIIKSYALFLNKSEAGFINQMKQWLKDGIDDRAYVFTATNFNFDFDSMTHIFDKYDFDDGKDSFRSGVYVTESDVKMAGFLADFQVDKLDSLGEMIAKAYIKGFAADGKDHTKRSKVGVVAVVGQEKIAKVVMKYLREMGKMPFVSKYEKTELNHQAEYDHKFDIARMLDEEAMDLMIKGYTNAYESQKDQLLDYGGIMYMEKFGPEPFSPKENQARMTLSEDQQVLFQKLQTEHRQMHLTYIPETERSFCIVAFPTPDIGEPYEAIFEDIIEINSLDSDYFSKIQQSIIDALDEGEYVHVLGKGNNKTDIKVMLQEIKDGSKETNFSNCVADVNIPVGEVFTSPQLTGTIGKLHVEKVFLDGFNYKNLELDFIDGEIDKYTCTNFDSETDNMKYIEENLMFPHKSLPIGEFAIGTNTLAYTVAKKYDIVDKLPILIVEKMGPHFAVGDTCYMWSEDQPVYNPDGKEITARHNERSRLEDVSKAYTNCHTDITIPYDAIGEISVMKADGSKIEIIIEGKFVLPGTEGLNEYF